MSRTVTVPNTAMDLVLNAPQSAIYEHTRPGMTLCTPWGRGVGKSWWLLTSLLLAVARYDGVERDTINGGTTSGVRAVLMCPTFKQAKDLYADRIVAALAPGGEWGFLEAKIDRTSWRIRFPGGSWIQLFGAENAQASRGLRCDIVAMDEADDIDLDVFDSIISPWFTESWSLKIRFVAGTPRRGRYGILYRTHMRGTSANSELRVDDFRHRPDHFSFKATGFDTPETVDSAYLSKMKAETAPATFAREYMCDFDSAEGLVFPHFDVELHVRDVDENATFSEVIVGCDYGFEDPGVFLVLGVYGHGRDVVLHVLEEVYETHQVESWWVEKSKQIAARYPNARWFHDPSVPARIEALRHGAHIKIEGAQNAIEDGVACVADAMGVRLRAPDGVKWSQLYVSKKCKNLIREIGVYRRRRDPKNPEQHVDAIEDRNNHAIDSLRYAIFSRFGTAWRTRSEQGAEKFRY